jgi:NAD(P)-dependent dehydrogenase (short-subunit alcohol dehydrogenase family)
MTGRVQGKVALVTGAASVPGLGSVTAQRLAAEGAVVYLTDVDADGVERVAAGIRADGGKAKSMAHDVTSEADWDRVMATIEREQGRLDVLVNNAGIFIPGHIEAVSRKDWTRQIEVNLTSVFEGTRRAVDCMRRTGQGGSIVNLSSVAGQVGVPGCASYSASKGGVRVFTKTVAMETARDRIRVNCVHPGMIMTNMQKVAITGNADQYDILNAAIPMGFMGDPLDVANCVLFLASDEARYITGAELTVDGGLTAQ